MSTPDPGAYDARRVARVIGPTASGFLRVDLGVRHADVPFDFIPADLRVPNSRFVMVFRNGGLIEIERDVERWVQILGTIEPVLITAWNPIGVPASWADEYRRYVSRIHSLLTSEVTDTEIAEELLRIETGQMGLRGSSLEHRLDVVRQLRHAVTGISSS